MALRIINFLKRYWWDFWVNFIGKSILIPRPIRYYIYKLAGLKTDSNNIASGVMFRGDNIKVGKGVLINHNVFIDCKESVAIGDDTYIAFEALICTSSHVIGNVNKRAGESDRHPVTIGNGCWIGAKATVLPGVTIGDGCIIAAGAVVNKDCSPNGLYAGVPAKRIRDLTVGKVLEGIS